MPLGQISCTPYIATPVAGMRTSRLSRDTARIASSLATSRTRRQLRQTRPVAFVAIQEAARDAAEGGHVARAEDIYGSESALKLDHEGTDSELSSAPEGSDWEPQDTAVSRKRKRDHDAPVVTKVKHETEEISLTEIASPKKEISKPKKARRIPAKKVVTSNGRVKVEPPPNWEEIYALTREMRNENVAPVDTMGCESLADRSASPRDQRFQTLISLMLSSQTKDTVTSAAIKGMQANMPGGFNLESVLALDPPALNAFICKVGFHNLKTKYIKAAAEILRDKWNSDIPDTIEGLTSLPGVGPKMAYLCMSSAWKRDEGIGVDVHVHRITNLWGWHKTSKPEETRAALESWLPKDRWHDINNLLVGFGQTICLPVGRKCGECKLADRGLCPSAVVGKKTKVKREEDIVETETPGGRVNTKKESIVTEQEEIKAEELECAIPDIEDLGSGTRRRTPRKMQ